MLSRDQILAAAPTLPVEEVEVPEWGGTVRVQGLSAADADAFLASSVKRSRGNGAGEFDRHNFQSRLLAECLIGEDGAKLFTPKDVEALGKKSAIAVGRIVPVALRLSGMGPEDMGDAKGN